jgi:iron complex outermembrane receptor protein
MKHPVKLVTIAILQFAGAAIVGAQSTTTTTTTTTSTASTSDQTVVLNPFQVSAVGDKGYNTANSTGATMINSPIRDTPMSISVLNQQFIQDIGATDPVQAAQYISGVAPVANAGSGQITVRGQNIPGANIRDGIPDLLVSNGNIFQDTALAERIEIIKGPEGTLYGDYSAYGGLMNIVSKVPEDRAASSLSLTYGADLLGGAVIRSVYDTTGPDPSNSAIDYRLILVGARGKTLQGGQDSTFIISPILTYHFKGGGSVLLRYSYQNPDRGTNEYSWFVDSTGAIPTFISPKKSIPDLDAGRNTKIMNADVVLTQPFKTGPIDWTARLFIRWDHLDNWEHLYEQAPANFQFFTAAGQSIGNITNTAFSNPNWSYIEITPRTRTTFGDYIWVATENADLVGRFDLGPTKNTLLFYGQTLNEGESNDQWAGSYPFTIIYSKIPGLGPIHYSDEAAAQTSVGGSGATSLTDTHTSLWAYGAQENMAWFDDKVILVAGIREDRQNQTAYNYFAKTFHPDDVRTGTTHKYGVVAHPVEPLTLYYNWAQTFTPNGFSTDVNGNTIKLPNLNSFTREEGAKLALFHSSLIISGAYFLTEVADATVSIPEINSRGQSVAVTVPAGHLVIRGWEADGTYAFNQNISLIFGAGNLTSKSALNLAARGVPFGTNYRVFGKYTFVNTGAQWLNGLFIGIGVQHNSLRAADANDDATMPPYTLTDALIGYSWGNHWRVQGNMDNVFDITYASVGVARQIMYAGLPRNESATITYNW